MTNEEVELHMRDRMICCSEKIGAKHAKFCPWEKLRRTKESAGGLTAGN